MFFESLKCFINQVYRFFIHIVMRYKKEIANKIIELCPDEKYVRNIENLFVKSYENKTIEWNDNIYELVNVRDYFAIKSNKNIEIKWKTRIIFETTPRGNIVMMYDTFNEAFIYHSDNSGVPYKILNAVAMKYVLMFRCRDFFVDENSIPEGYSSPFILNRKEVDIFEKNKIISFVNELSSTSCDNSPFAKLKSRVSTVSDKKQKMTEIVCKIQNRFIYQGKLLNYSFLKKPIVPKQKICPETSYRSYKKMLLDENVCPIQNDICSSIGFYDNFPCGFNE